MNTFDLVLADNGVLERGAIGKDKDSVRVVTLNLAGAGNATAVGLKTTVERAGDLHGGLESLGAGGGGDGERGTLGHALMELVYASGVVRLLGLLTEEVGWCLLRWTSSGKGGESQDGGSDRTLHVDGLDWIGKIEKASKECLLKMDRLAKVMRQAKE
jgi:hypothetical protein